MSSEKRYNKSVGFVSRVISRALHIEMIRATLQVCHVLKKLLTFLAILGGKCKF